MHKPIKSRLAVELVSVNHKEAEILYNSADSVLLSATDREGKSFVLARQVSALLPKHLDKAPIDADSFASKLHLKLHYLSVVACAQIVR